MKRKTFIPFVFMLLTGSMTSSYAQSQVDILNHWAPEVYHDVNTSRSWGRQYYSARDIMLAVDFDGDWYAGNNWANSKFQVWEQGQLNDRLTPPMRGVIYSALVETQNFYFLTYGVYHSGDDSNISADRHENDWEGMHAVIEKDGSTYGQFRGAVTEFHREKRAYTASDFQFNGSHPKIYISANGTFDLFSPSKHGHGVETFTGNGYQAGFGSDAIVYQVAERNDNIMQVDIPGSNTWANALRYDYKLISIHELWNRRGNPDTFNGYTQFRGGDSGVGDGGTSPWERGYFQDPITYYRDRNEFNFLDSKLNGDSYIYNPFFGNQSSQSDITNPTAILPALNGWNASAVGSGAGKVYNGQEAFLIDARGSDIWNSNDAFYYVYKTLEGDGSITAKVNSVQNIDVWTKAGLMIRETTAANAKNAFVVVTPDNAARLSLRSSVGGGTSYSGVFAGFPDNQSFYIRLTRQGNTFTAAYSLNGSSFTDIGSTNITMGQVVKIGMAVTSHNSSEYAAAVFNEVSLSGSTNASARKASANSAPLEEEIEAAAFSPVRLYPNPASEAVTIVLPAGWNNTQLKVFDRLGRSVLEKEGVPSGELTMNVNMLPVGVYTVIIQSEGGTFTSKFVKE